jgi:hypothetical protein
VVAIGALVAMIWLGHLLAGPLFRHAAWPYRLALAFTVGLPVTTWLIFLAALPFSASDRPLVPAALLILLAAALLAIVAASRRWSARDRRAVDPAAASPRRIAFGRWDALTVGIGAVLVTWMTTATFGMEGTALRVGIHEIGDFGPNTALVQGFVIGHNVPPEYPLFAGEPIRYHFLFYLGASILTLLGFDPALANNLLTIGSTVALLVLLIALGERLFGSRAVGRIGALLFFVHGSLSFIPWALSFESPEALLAALPVLDQFLASPFPYRGEDWAIWAQNVFLNQRHLASSIAVFVGVLLFVVDREPTPSGPPVGSSARWRTLVARALTDRDLRGYVLCGLLLGLMPLWNGAVYLASAVVMAAILVLFTRRIELLVTGLVAGLVSLPQILFLRPPGDGPSEFPAFRPGFVVNDPTIIAIAAYMAFLFGPKIVLMAVALASGTGRQRRFFLSISTLVVLVFLVQLSVDIANNHKALTLWLVLANLFAAAGLLWLWRTAGRVRGRVVPRGPQRAVAAILAGVIVVGGTIDLIPIHNDRPQVLAMEGDRLFEWTRTETDPRDVFLSDLYIHHPILRAGRRIYLGWPAYALSMGYDMAGRERIYRELLSSTSARDVVRGLQEAGIDYVAIDDGMREGGFVTGLNEALYREHLPIAFEDREDAYRNLVIFRVPDDPDAWRSLPGAPAVDMYTGGRGDDAGRFDEPRGIAVAPDGTVVVADSNNGRIQRFAGDGTFLDEFGSPGEGPGMLEEPNGLAVDARGHVHVADALNDRVQEFAPDGSFVRSWDDASFYGPRDVAVGEDGTLYVLDQGRARVVVRAADGTISEFGSFGSGDGQFDDPTGLGVGGGRIAVADPRNGRIVVFGADGRPVRMIPIEGWGAPFEYPDVAVDARRGLILASRPSTNEVLVLTFDGRLVQVLPGVESDGDTAIGPIALRADGAVLAADVRGHRVVLYEPAP